MKTRLAQVLAVSVFIPGGLLLAACSASAQQNQRDCSPFFDAVAAGNAKVPAVVPDRLFLDTDLAIRCLVAVSSKINTEIGQTGASAETSAKLLSTTAAIRTLMTTPSYGQPRAALASFVDAFQKSADADLNVASALSYGARDENADLRLNSVLILGNVIDDATVCVPIVQLNDPRLLGTPTGVRARANLLGIVNVVAPYASRENFNNLQSTIKSVEKTFDRGDPNFNSTSRLLANISARLAAQTDSSNKNVTMPENQRRSCDEYFEHYTKINAISIENVKY